MVVAVVGADVVADGIVSPPPLAGGINGAPLPFTGEWAGGI